MASSKKRVDIPATVADLPPITPDHELGGRLRIWLSQNADYLSFHDLVDAAVRFGVTFKITPKRVVQIDIYREQPSANDESPRRLLGL